MPPASITSAPHNHELYAVPSHTHGISHTHTVSIPKHSHAVSISAHRHSLTISSHSHNVSIPSHTHDISYGIFQASESPTSAIVKVGNNVVAQMSTEYEGDITAFLVDSNGTIPRGRFIEISVTPNTFAYVTISVAAQGFIQSKEGGRY